MGRFRWVDKRPIAASLARLCHSGCGTLTFASTPKRSGLSGRSICLFLCFGKYRFRNHSSYRGCDLDPPPPTAAPPEANFFPDGAQYRLYKVRILENVETGMSSGCGLLEFTNPTAGLNAQKGIADLPVWRSKYKVTEPLKVTQAPGFLRGLKRLCSSEKGGLRF